VLPRACPNPRDVGAGLGFRDADGTDAPAHPESGGQIGLHLIDAFSSQLEAEAEQGRIETESGPAFRIVLRFSIRRSGDADDA
jgi:hypothetical protein